MIVGFDFGTAIEYLKDGEAIFRLSWEKKNIVYNNSEEKLEGWHVLIKDKDEVHIPIVENSPFLTLVDLETSKETPWIPTYEDMFAEDWMIYCE